MNRIDDPVSQGNRDFTHGYEDPDDYRGHGLGPRGQEGNQFKKDLMALITDPKRCSLSLDDASSIAQVVVGTIEQLKAKQASKDRLPSRPESDFITLCYYLKSFPEVLLDDLKFLKKIPSKVRSRYLRQDESFIIFDFSSLIEFIKGLDDRELPDSRLSSLRDTLSKVISRKAFESFVSNQSGVFLRYGTGNRGLDIRRTFKLDDINSHNMRLYCDGIYPHTLEALVRGETQETIEQTSACWREE